MNIQKAKGNKSLEITFVAAAFFCSFLAVNGGLTDAVFFYFLMGAILSVTYRDLKLTLLWGVLAVVFALCWMDGNWLTVEQEKRRLKQQVSPELEKAWTEALNTVGGADIRERLLKDIRNAREIASVSHD